MVTDPEKQAIAQAVASAAAEVNADVTIATMTLRQQDGHEPPRPIVAAMRASDVIFTPVAVSITHTSAIRDACDAGSRAVVMTGFTPSMMQGGGLDADFGNLNPSASGWLATSSAATMST